MKSFFARMANCLKKLIKDLGGAGKHRRQDCLELGGDKDENRAFPPVPENSPFPDQPAENLVTGKHQDRNRPGFGSVCFAESHEVRDEYKDGVQGEVGN